MDWIGYGCGIGWYPGGVRYRAAYGANNMIANMNDDGNCHPHNVGRMSISVNRAQATISIELNWKYASTPCLNIYNTSVSVM